MGNFRPLKTKCLERFLSEQGYSYNRTKGSHDQWTKRGSRTIPIWGDEKDIPAQHLKAACHTIGITLAALYKWAHENC